MDQGQWAQAVHQGMGTSFLHKAYGCRARRALPAVQREMKRLEGLLNRFDPGSEISRINRFAGVKPAKVGSETFELLRKALEISRLSGGAFDITVGPLARLWDCQHAAYAPEGAAVLRALGLTGFSSLALDAAKMTAGLKLPGQLIDLGGVGKGYAGDRAMDIFRKYGVASAFTNIGGNVSILGSKPGGAMWQVGIRHPRQADALVGAVGVANQSVVTSGDYERYFVDREGKRRHHLLNPATGCPAESGLISVTVVHKSAMLADALSTALFVLGREKGLALLGRFPSAGAVLVEADLAVHVTKGLRDCFEPARGIRADVGS